MSTPAGWYDDGSGRQRWWDGTQWTEHFAPNAPVEDAAPAVEASPVAESTPAYEPPAIPPAPGFDATAGSTPGYTQPAGGAPAPGAYGDSAYAAPVYPGATATEPAAKRPPHLIAWLGLGAAALGFILACIPGVLIAGWVLLPIGLILSIVAFFFKGAKWPAITGVILAVVGGIVAVIVAIAVIVSSAQQAFEEFEDTITQSPDDGQIDSEDEPDAEVDETGSLGESVTLEQYTGTAEVTIESATWGTTNGSDFAPDATNGGFLIIEVVWTGVEDTTNSNPLYFSVTDAAGVEGTLDIFAPEMLEAAQVAPGEEVRGTISFDVSDAGPYTVSLMNELMQPVAEITVEASAR